MSNRNPEPNVWVDNGDSLFCVSLPMHDIKIDVSTPIGKVPTLCTIQVREAGKLVYQIDSRAPTWAPTASLILRLLAEHAGCYQ